MSAARDASDARERLRAIEAIIEDLRRVADPRSLAGAQELVGAVLSLHADGMARILEIVRAKAVVGGATGGSLLDALAGDDLVASLLLLHGLHPVPLEQRVRAALAKLAPLGWTVELTGVGDGAVLVAATRSALANSKRSPTAQQVRALVEEAIGEAAPDAEGVEVTAPEEEAAGGFVPIERLTAARSAAGGGTR
jgi:hypothetical protein